MQRTAKVLAGVRRLRFEIYPLTPHTFAADNLYLNIGG